MLIYISNLRKYISYLFIVIFFSSCQERDWKNPYDHGVDINDIVPKILNIESISANKVKLKWVPVSSTKINYIIERKKQNGQFTEIYQTVNNFCYDTVSTLNFPYTYR